MNWDAVLKSVLAFVKSFGIKLLLSGLYVVIGLRIIKWIKKWIKNSQKLDKIEDGVRSFIASVAGALLYIVLFITVAVILGIPTTSFVAALASVFAAIGLAMQGTLSNFAGGVMIMIFKPFKVGDYIVAPTEEAEGTVVDISLVYTVLHTADNQEITVPNGTLTNSVVKNLSSVDKRRVDIIVSTSYDSDIEKVKGIIAEIMENHPQVLSDPKPVARLSEHAESALKFSVRAWCSTENYWDVRFDLLETIKDEFDKNNISIPLPQLDVHFDQPNEKSQQK